MDADRLHEGPHWADGPVECFGCRVKTFSVNPYSMPSRLNPNKHPKPPNLSYERGVPRDNRGMPYLTKSGGPMGQKEFNAKRHVIAERNRTIAHAQTQ